MENFKIHRIITKISRDKQNKQNKKRPFWFWLLMFFVSIGAIGVLTVFIFLLFLFKDLPDIDDMGKLNFAQSTLILDRQGNELYSIHGEENRKVISLQEIPDSLVKATLAIEDAQFFDHKGFDLTGILRSVWRNVTDSGSKVGGSTITQQFIKNTFLTREKTYIRKLKELVLAVQLENRFSKEEIMEMYLNSIPYGSNAYGVESASETYFAKLANELSLAESVVLAALPQAPSYYSPYGQHRYSEVDLVDTEAQKDLEVKSEEELLEKFPESVTRGLLGKVVYLNENTPIYVRGRADLVLLRMQELGYISDEEKEQAWSEMQSLEFRSARTNIKAPHFVMYVKEELEKKYGKEVIEKGGLKVYTTLNPELQKTAEEIVKRRGDANVANCGANNAALISVEPKTGQILAMVGSRDYWDTENDGNVNVNLMKRLPGSSFKPFVYATGFLKGYSPATMLFDVQTDFGNNYKPKNFDGTFRGLISVRHALGNSLNIPAVKMGFMAGNANVYELTKAMGLTFEKDADWYGGAFPLGVAEVRPLDMLGAYTVFANNGNKIPLTPFLRVEDDHGNILEEWKMPVENIVLDPQVAYSITDILSDSTARGSGWNTFLQLKNRQNAVKTGTSNKKINEVHYPMDGWTIGFTPQLATSVWIGNNDGSVLKQNASGFNCTSGIWKDFMEEALAGIPEEKFVKPQGMRWINVSRLTGLLPTKSMPNGLVRSEIFGEINAPKQYDNSIKTVEIDRVSGKLVTEYTPKDAIEKRVVVNFRSEMPTKPNWELPVQRWANSYGSTYLSKFGVTNILVKAPQEYDDVHTAQTGQEKPEVTIVSPVAFGAVSPPSIGVNLNIRSEVGIQKVEFYWDGELKNTATKSPWKGNLQISERTALGSTHTISVKVYDSVYNTTTAQIEVKIASDDDPPHTEIVFPQNGQKIEKGSQITVKTYSYDAKSDIDKVVFYLNGKEVGRASESPYEKIIVLPTGDSKAKIKVIAYDQTANSAEDEVEVKLTSNGSTVSKIQIISPASNTFIQKTDNLTIVAEVPTSATENLLEVNLIEQDLETKKMTVLTTLNNFGSDWNGKIMTTWVPSKSGVYEFFVRTKDSAEKLTLSEKVRVTVQGE